MDHEAYLRRRADVLAAGFDRAGRALLITDAEGHVAAATPGAGELLGCATDDLVGRPVAGMFRPQDLFDARNCGFRGHMLPLSAEARHAAGHWVAVEIRCEPFEVRSVIGDDEAPAVHGLLTLTDVRQREHEDELRAVRLAKLSLLNQVSEALYGANLTLEQVLQAVLICVTAGEGLRFNRAFLLLVDEKHENLRGELAIGPGSGEEASHIWRELAGESADLYEMMTTYDRSIKQSDVAVNEIARRMIIPLGDVDNLLVRSMHERHTLRASRDLPVPGVEAVAGWLGSHEFAIAPLTTRRGPLGVILADNAISGTPITGLDLEFLQMFANQSASAIENSRLYHELERRLLDLRRAHQKQRENQETLLRMERLSVMGETSAVVAHELRNPLVSIGGFARTLHRALDKDDPNREFARIITEDVARMETIVNDMLDFVRPQKQTRQNVVLDRLVADTVGRHVSRIDAEGIELHYDLQCGETTVPCHPGEIRQVVENFLNNARQAVPKDGVIRVTTSLLEGGARVAVSDNGPGFADDIVDEMFTPFFSTKPRGSGLGLTICDQIIKAHGGIREATNRPEGGAEFAFILPLAKPGETV